MKRFEILILGGLVLGLTACGGDRAPEETAAPATPDSTMTSDAGSTAETTSAPQIEAAPPVPADVPKVSRKDLVAQAASPGKPGAPIEFKYQLAEAPQVGQPLVIDFSVVPTKSSEAVHLMVATSGGLTLQRNSAPAVLRDLEAGNEYWHELVVTPQEDGIFNVSLIATVGEGNQALARTLSIPVVVGAAAMQSDKARKLNVEVDATGQAIEVMPGQESR